MEEKPIPKIGVHSTNNDARSDSAKVIAFYLPQFHPIPENDAWWGKGFTEWTNVTKARPMFAGHYQPRLPGDIGFYDLRLREIRHQQIQLAQKYGIYGFCYHYYWFSGTRLLNGPIDDMLSDVENDFPFCLCWANENWTRRWDAKEHEILIAQKFLPGDDVNFIKELLPFFRDPRYIRLDGAPLLIVYRPQQLPNPKRTTETWREFCAGEGIPEIHLCAALTHGNEEYTKYGFDSGVQFPPHNLKVETINKKLDFCGEFRGRVYNYPEIAESYLEQEYKNSRVFRTVFPSWDNTARRNERATIVLNGTPENYEYWLSETIRRAINDFQAGDCLVFVNAWNEWAEGCYLEPDRKNQHSFLEATLRAVTGESTLAGFQHKEIQSLISKTGRRTLFGDLRYVFGFHFDQLLDRIRVLLNNNPRIKAFVLPVVTFGRKIFF